MKRINKSRLLKNMTIQFIFILLLGCALPMEKSFDYSETFFTDEYDGGIIFYGDTRKHHRFHRAIIKNILACDPIAVFHLGDAVSEGNSFIQWNDFNSITKYVREEIPFYPVIGNHEKGVDPHWYLNHWEVSIGQGYYSLDILDTGQLRSIPIDAEGVNDYSGRFDGNPAAHVVVLHTNPTFLEAGSAQYTWLMRDLEEYADTPTLLVFHIPLFCAGIHYDEMDDEHPANILYSVIGESRFNIIACISGHDHAYERFSVNGMKQIVTGCAGESPYEISRPDHPSLEKYEAVYHFTVMTFRKGSNIGSDMLVFTVFDINLNIIDTFEITL